MVIIFILSSTLILLVSYFNLEQREHDNKILNTKYRIHVNGTRGKSSVSRLLAYILNNNNIKTLGKTTGTSAKIIHHDTEQEIVRKGPPTVIESVNITRNHLSNEHDAIVYECMAVQPRFQKFLEQKVMKSNIGIITNVREDHMEEQGYTLEEIAEALCSTIPKNGHLVCAEDNPKLVKIIKDRTNILNSKFIDARKYAVDEERLKKLHYIEHRENIAIAFAVADIIKIDRDKVWEGIKKVVPDDGALNIKSFKHSSKNMTWINLLAVNDPKSVLRSIETLNKHFIPQNAHNVAILNNREDRPDRAIQFIELSSKHFQDTVLIGELKREANNILGKNKNIISFDSKLNTPDDLLKKISKRTNNKNINLFGLGNIHTEDGDLILEYMTNVK